MSMVRLDLLLGQHELILVEFLNVASLINLLRKQTLSFFIV